MNSKVWIRLLLLTSACVMPLRAEDSDTTAETQRHQATTLFRSGDYAQSIALYRNLAKNDPKNIDAQKDLMWVLWNAGQFENAGAEADRILTMAPNDIEAKTLAGRAFLTAHREKILALRKQAAAGVRAGRYAEAVELFNESTSLDPGNYRLLKDAMFANMLAGYKTASVLLAKRVLVLRPEDSDALEVLNQAIRQSIILDASLPLDVQLRLAAARAQAGQVKEGIQWIQRLEILYPDNVDILRYLTSLYHRSGRFTEGLQTAARWTTRRPQDPRSWFWLGVLQVDNGRMEAAQTSYEHSLALDPNQPHAELAMGRFYLTARDFQTAIVHLEKAHKADSKLIDVYPLLGKAYYWNQTYGTSAAMWKEAISDFPSRKEYRFSEAQALYYAGRRAEALEKMRTLCTDPNQPAALLFLVDDARAAHDTDTAVHLLETRLKTLVPTDETLVVKLCGLYNDRHAWNSTVLLSDRFLAVHPESQTILLLKGNALYARHEYKAASATSQKILLINPYDINALQSLAASERAQGHRSTARQLLQRLRDIDPTNPDYVRLQAEDRYNDGGVTPANTLVHEWMNENSSSTIVPILLYHALTPFAHDPVLAYPYHLSVATFEDQMAALRSAGYAPITTDQLSRWSHHLGTLPAKPILVTFDDARLDSYLYGDPVLQKTGMRASMFVPLVNVEGARPPGFLPWTRLKEAQKSGRWEIESHGGDAHLHVPINAAGNEGLFLVNLRRLSKENRLETSEEWHERIAHDYQASFDTISKMTGVAPNAYAYPEGIYGQQGTVDTPDALTTNLALVSKTYSTAYTEDRPGMNLQSRDPYRLNRMEPSNSWTGAQLIQHFHDDDPRVAMLGLLFNWAVREGRVQDAQTLLKQMKSYDISDGLRLSKEAEMALATGDLTHGESLAQQALSMGEFPDLRRDLADARRGEAWSWNPSVTYEEDSSNRRSLLLEQAVRTRLIGAWRFGLRQEWGWFRDDGAGTIYNDGAGLEAQYLLNSRNRLTAVAMGQGFSSPSGTTFSASGTWESAWENRVNTILSGGQKFIPTASAIADQINDRYVGGRALWDINDRWRVATDDRYSNFTDGNNRISTQDEVSRLLWSPIHLRWVYQFTYNNTSEIRPQYYSPQDLIMNEMGPEFFVPLHSHVRWWLRYTPGYSTEDHVSGQWDHTLDTYLDIHWGSNGLTPEFQYYQTPTYHERLYRLDYVHYF